MNSRKPAYKLVIVESPAKARTISKFLGRNYKVEASQGHVRDLPKSQLGVDVEHDFEPKYITIRGRGEVLERIRKEAKGAKSIILATDPDREGEAISWHLATILGIDPESECRVEFNEITEKTVKSAIKQPRAVNMQLVNAQQARRLLDRLVGYKISPLLWVKIKKGLSAGRVQSVATRMVVDREQEIEQFEPEEYWFVDAELRAGGKQLHARLIALDGERVSLSDQAQADAAKARVEQGGFVIRSVKRGEKRKHPAPPFTTSNLQQEASRKLGFTTAKTMQIAQQLYEGVDIQGEGSVGLITYMRTDSLRISEEAIAAAKDFILSRYGKAYYPPKANHYKAKANAQDAHEAIRPSNVRWTPEDVKASLTGEQYRLYKLIWSRFLACQMANAVYDSVSVEILNGEHSFRASSSSLKFSGYTAVYEEGKDEEKSEKEPALPPMGEGEVLALKTFRRDQHFTLPPAHYTDATLIRAMEEQGIGRPSTYAPTVSTILDRRYVRKEGKYLHITNLGRGVTEWMERYFSNIEDLKFTAQMERELDEVEEGRIPWKKVLRGFYDGFEKRIETALEGDRQPIEAEVTEEICPECGRNLVVKSGRFGDFLACPGYPECSFTMPMVEVMPGRCPKCGGRLMKRGGTSKSTGKPYTYYCCENSIARNGEPTCDFRTFDVPVKDDCPVCGQTMFKKSGKGFKRPFCINPACENFVPEDKRGYVKKTAEPKTEGGEVAQAEEKPAGKTAAKTAAAKKTAARKTAAAKKPAAKKTTRKTAAKKAEKPAGDGE